MVGKVLFNGRIHSPRLPQRTQNSGETGHLRNRIIRIRKGIQNIFHRPGAINPQEKAVDAPRKEERSVNQHASAKQQHEYAIQPSGVSDISRSIKENYSSGRGDLLYGLCRERNKIIRQIYPDGIKDASIQCIDSINSVKNDCARSIVYSKGSVRDEYTAFREQHNSFEDVDAYVHTMLQQDAIGKKDPKYNVRERFEDFYKLRKKIINERGKIDNDLRPQLYEELYNIFKRGCKAGIMSATLDSSKHHIHFSLDGIDMNSVITKNNAYTESGLPSITGSELRCAYRLRDQLKDKLHFYENGLEVSAPWEKNPELWRKYIPKGAQKKDPPGM
ncbi:MULTISPECIES: hypothetical protein [Escherichia]|uniref:hypothetical protein n=1 Tax=Escherichia TaxID=561 RepID=UPI0001CF689A|nr:MULTISPECIES: hypothetical protein [Escherichia]MED0414365.1 hypothetical protein [Escherichia marmotae]EFF04669.1 predicted protein [Escherichia coli B185]MEC9878449.1 hypothetical protein [Escherichia ruysiae]MEC9886754.1 hypothetical protein [Escherichia ruysiae]MED9040605.1 hypothetical protein [Escherichia ruysiae]